MEQEIKSIKRKIGIMAVTDIELDVELLKKK